MKSSAVSRLMSLPIPDVQDPGFLPARTKPQREIGSPRNRRRSRRFPIRTENEPKHPRSARTGQHEHRSARTGQHEQVSTNRSARTPLSIKKGQHQRKHSPLAPVLSQKLARGDLCFLRFNGGKPFDETFLAAISASRSTSLDLVG